MTQKQETNIINPSKNSIQLFEAMDRLFKKIEVLEQKVDAANTKLFNIQSKLR